MEAFTREADFERALIAALQRQGWKNDRSDQNNSWEDRALLTVRRGGFAAELGGYLIPE